MTRSCEPAQGSALPPDGARLKNAALVYDTCSMLQVNDHPLLDLRAFVTRFPRPLGELSVAEPGVADVAVPLSPEAHAPLASDDDVRRAVRDLLRAGGFKPTGRSKPSSEYLLKAAADATLRPINLAVDCCNAVSLHSGLPISVVDLDRTKPPLRVALAGAGERYVFNPAGQVIDVSGLLCLVDAQGPCACPVKDAQRTKTDDATTQTLTLIWGTGALAGRAAAAEEWYTALLEQHGAAVEHVFP